MTVLLEVREARAGYGEVEVLEGVSVAIEEGSITAVIGSNGAGKTTLMRAMAGLVDLRMGEVRFEGRAVQSLAAHERCDAGIALVPEGRLVFPDFTVAETLRIGAFTARSRPGWQERAERMYELFPRLRQRRATRAGLLSGGEQQMLALARGLMSVPKVLLLDEPSLGLAPAMADEVFDGLLAIRQQGITVGLVEQNVHAALSIADHAYVMEDGHVVRSAPARELVDDGAIREAYLGL